MSDDIAGRTPADTGDGPGHGLEALTDEVLPALIARLRASRLGELEVRSGEWRVRLRRDPDATLRSTVAGPSGARDEPEAISGSVARSQAVGYFTPARDVVVGHSVQAGDALGTIDVLGITQEVTAPEDGIIAAVLAEDGQAVEFGQAVVEIDPLEPEIGADDGEDLA